MAWVAAAPCSALADRDVVAVECEGRQLALYRVDDGIFASIDRCPHQGASLANGCVVSGYIECPVHFALFDIRTGESDGSVTTRCLQTFATRVEGNIVYVDMPSTEERGV